MQNLPALPALALLMGLLSIASPATAQTQSTFQGPFEVSPFGNFQEIDKLYHRYRYPQTRVIFFFETNRNGLLPEDGETWKLVFRNEKTDTVLAETILTYDAGSDCLVDQNGVRPLCGLYPDYGSELHFLTIAYNTICLDEVEHSIEITLSDGSSPDGSPFEFVAQRFRPRLADLQKPGSINPELPGDSFASRPIPGQEPGQADITFRVVDDLGCQQPLERTDIEMTNRIVSGSGGHAHFGADAEGDGRYLPQNPSDGFNADTPHKIAGEVNDQAIFRTRYEAGELGVTEEIEIAMIRPPREFEPDEIRVTDSAGLDIKVPDLERLQPTDMDPFIFAYGGTCAHPDEGGSPSQQYLIAGAKAQFTRLDRIYHELTGNHLSFNDASLPFGGRFENKNDGGRDSRCHSSHRRGIDIDINGRNDAQGASMRRGVEYRGEVDEAVDVLTNEVERRLQVEQVPEEPIHYRYMGILLGREG